MRNCDSPENLVPERAVHKTINSSVYCTIRCSARLNLINIVEKQSLLKKCL